MALCISTPLPPLNAIMLYALVLSSLEVIQQVLNRNPLVSYVMLQHQDSK